MGGEETRVVLLEERLVMAVVEFANSKGGKYNIAKLTGRNKDAAYGECLSVRVVTDSGSFLAGARINDKGKVVPPVFPTATPDEKLYGEFCDYLDSVSIPHGTFEREED